MRQRHFQAQGDLLVAPQSQLADRVWAAKNAQWQEVPANGVELLRGAAGGNAHSLVADPDTCAWTADVDDRDGLAIAMFDALSTVYLLHREHGATGIAAGLYVVRRQRELSQPRVPLRRMGIASHRGTPRAIQRVADSRPGFRLVAD